MFQLLLPLVCLFSPSTQAQALRPELSVSIREVTSEYAIDLSQEASLISVAIAPTPAPIPAPATNHSTAPHSTVHVDIGDTGILTTLPPTTEKPTPGDGPVTLGGVDLNQLLTLGGKIWDFVVNNKPTADYQIFKTSIVPSGITNWTQLRGWQRPVSKVYRVQFKDIFGGSAGSLDYRITYIAGGSYNGKGKFLGEISFVPMNIKLHTDRSLKVRAELSEPLNYGTEDDPVAAAQLLVTWSSPTTTRFQMNSAEYFIYGTGEIDDLTHGN